jgi:hypothetical protein
MIKVYAVVTGIPVLEELILISIETPRQIIVSEQLKLWLKSKFGF